MAVFFFFFFFFFDVVEEVEEVCHWRSNAFLFVSLCRVSRPRESIPVIKNETFLIRQTQEKQKKNSWNNRPP